MRIEASRQINAPVERVFDVFTDIVKTEERIDGIMSVEILEGGDKMSEETRWRETRMMFGKEATEEMWVTDFQPNHSYTVEAESHGTHYISTYTFKPNENGTLVEMSFEGEPQSFGAKVMDLTSFLFKGTTKKALEADMQDLKEVCETESS